MSTPKHIEMQRRPQDLPLLHARRPFARPRARPDPGLRRPERRRQEHHDAAGHGHDRARRRRDPRARPPHARGAGRRQARRGLRSPRKCACCRNATLGWHMDFMKSIYPGWDGGYAATLVKRFNLRAEQNARLSLRRTRQGGAAAGAGTPAAAADPRRTDHRTRSRWRATRSSSEFMDVLRDESRSILFSSHNTRRRGAHLRPHHLHRPRPVVDSRDKEDFLDRWRRIQVQLPPGTTLPETAEHRAARRSMASSSR